MTNDTPHIIRQSFISISQALGPLAATVVGSIALLCGLGCSGQPDDYAGPMPNVLLISIDTLRSDHCSMHGYARETTPTLRSVAKEGARFDLAYAPSATTLPSHATMFTGLYPIAHRVIKNGLILDEDHLTLAEILSAEGYETAGIASSFVLDAKFGVAQGFDFYDDDFKQKEATWAEREQWEGFELDGAFDRRADFATDRAIAWLERKRRGGQPFFLFVHYFDPHAPYAPPASFAAKFAPEENSADEHSKTIALYDAEIAFTDEQIARLLAAVERLGLNANTILVITADHGEGLMQHGWPSHGIHIYEEAVHVPLIFRWPGKIDAAQVLDEPVSLADLMPTILTLTGSQMNDLAFQGITLSSALDGTESLDPQRTMYLHRRHYKGRHYGKSVKMWAKGEKFAVRAGKWKYIEGVEEGTKELFDLAVDPGETNNLADSFPDQLTALATMLQGWKERSASAEPIQSNLSDEDRRRLRSLGYVE